MKSNFSNLNSLADNLSNAATGLKELGQFDLESLVTSLSVARLAKPMREQWELYTDSSK